jgi:hypothetical protein
VSHTLNLGWTNRSETISAPVTVESEGENNRDVSLRRRDRDGGGDQLPWR